MRRQKELQDFTVNEFISLKLDGKRTEIYVDGELFRSCKYLLISIPIDEIEEWDYYDSMDEIIKATQKGGGERHASPITPEEAFWGHCSNLQAWVDSGYNYRVLDTRLSIPIILLILRSLVKNREKVKFRKFFLEVVSSLDDYIINSRQNDYTYDKFNFLSRVVLRTKDKYFTDEEISGSIILKHVYDRFLERSIRRKKQQKYLYQEAKLWGTGKFNLMYRHLLRRIRDAGNVLPHERKKLITSDEIDYLPYLYSMGEFTECGSICIYYANGYRLIIRDENGLYWKNGSRY